MILIYKYTPDRLGKISIPMKAKILTAQMQGTDIVIWAEVDTDNFNEDRRFTIVGTGWDLGEEPSERTYVATVQEPSGYVWHIFEIL
jgi:hypothetical protein